MSFGIVLLIFSCSFPGFSQATKSAFTYEYLEGYADASADTATAVYYLNYWIKKARAEHNFSEESKALRQIMFVRNPKFLEAYCDSILTAALKSKNDELLGKAWVTKGLVQYKHNVHEKAFECYVVADQYLSRTNDSVDIYKLKYAVANTKYFLGLYSEAIALFEKCRQYYKPENDVAYLSSIYSLSLCYYQLGNFKKCGNLTKLGLSEARKRDESSLDAYFNLSNGVNLFGTGDFLNSIKILRASLDDPTLKNDFASLSVAQYYLGKNYLKLHNDEKAVFYFKEVDSAFSKLNYLRSDLRDSYDFLIKHYKSKNDNLSCLYFTGRLLKLDSILHPTYKNLMGKVRLEYDSKKLINTDIELKHKIMVRNTYGVVILFCLVVLLSYMFFRNFKLKKFKDDYYMLADKFQLPQVSLPYASYGETDVEMEDATLKKLQHFEDMLLFLNADVNVDKLAKHLEINSRYTRFIIHKYRQKSFGDYIRDLKIDHIVHLLQTQKKYQRYSDKGLAEEAGFGSTQNFVRAFKKRVGSTPRLFIMNAFKESAK